MHRYPLPLAGTVLALMFTGAVAQEVSEDQVRAFMDSDVKSWLDDPLLIRSVKAQNARHAGLSEDRIKELDQQWRAETGAADQPLIDRVLDNELSGYLRQRQADSQGLITEVFVMDDKGLNVGQSDVTSDYWQGDEAKWQQTYGAGADALFIDEVEYDESSQRFQVQVSAPLSDPADGSVIGAITIGLDAEALID